MRARSFISRATLTVVAVLASVVGTTTVTAAAADPTRADSVDRPVYLIHGYDPTGHGWDCAAYWGPARDAMIASGWRGPIITYGYYADDTNCDVQFNGDRNDSITTIAVNLANDIYNRYTKNGKPVDIIGHSMGGLVARAALTGHQQQWPYFPKKLYVEDVATLSTPHGGVPLIGYCANTIEQCEEMRPGSSFLKEMDTYPNPQSTIGTDWTLIGADDDLIVPAWSATTMSAGHYVIFEKNKQVPVNHQSIHKITTGSFAVRYWNYTDKTWHDLANGAPPVRTAQNAAYWWYRW